MPESPVKTPPKVKPDVAPEEQPQRRMEPMKICPAQKTETVRRIAAPLP